MTHAHLDKDTSCPAGVNFFLLCVIFLKRHLLIYCDHFLVHYSVYLLGRNEEKKKL